MQKRMGERAIAARGFPENPAPSRAAAAIARLDRGHGLQPQEIVPAAHGGGVDVLVAAQPGEAVGEGNDAGGEFSFRIQTVGALGQVFAEILPVGVRGSARREPDDVDEERQAAPVLTLRNPDIDSPARRVAQKIALQDLALDVKLSTRPSGWLAVRMGRLLDLVPPRVRLRVSTARRKAGWGLVARNPARRGFSGLAPSPEFRGGTSRLATPLGAAP